MKLLIAAVFVLATPFAFAEDIIEENVTNWRAELERHETALTNLDNEIVRLTGVAARSSATLGENGCSWIYGQSMNCTNWAGLSDANQAAVGTALSEWAAAKSTMDKLVTDRESLVAKAESLRQQLNAEVTPRDPAQSITALANLLKVTDGEAKLQARWNKLHENEDELAEALDELEDHMDQTALGVYFQDKMAQFVNSSLACKMRRRCLSKEREEVDNKYIEELFPGMAKTRRSSQKYYDKTKNRRGGNQ